MAGRALTVIATVALGFALTSGAERASAQTPGVGDCQPNQYFDRSASGASRTLDWGFSIISAPERCLKVQQGQSVTWSGDLETHPLGANGGDQPNPIAASQSGVVTFNKTGTFGFICLSHSSMRGAVFVVPAPAQAAAMPAAPWWTLVGLAGALVAAALVMLRRRASY
jgi:hypothetical protein